MYSRSTGSLLLKAHRCCLSFMSAHGHARHCRCCSFAGDGLHRFVLAAHYIYTTWRVQYKRLFEFAGGP
ncbi:hypothetical protein E3U47_12640 [Pseudomonas sp. RIT623]|nr:hypothetical protein E3U47_12640 [Pseudomonas sp. RIT623]